MECRNEAQSQVDWSHLYDYLVDVLSSLIEHGWSGLEGWWEGVWIKGEQCQDRIFLEVKSNWEMCLCKAGLAECGQGCILEYSA